MSAAAPARVRTPTLVRMRRLAWRRPDWWVAVLVAAAWLVLFSSGVGDLGHLFGLAPTHHSPLDWLGHGAVMSAAMMVPLVLPTLRHVAFSSLWARRNRAQFLFNAGFLAVWSLVGATQLACGELVSEQLGRPIMIGLAFTSAIAWQLSPNRGRLLQRCQVTMPLTPLGWRADRDCLVFGARIGLSCVATCWALMFAVTTAHGPIVAAIILSIQFVERSSKFPRTRMTAFHVAMLGVSVLVGSMLSRS